MVLEAIKYSSDKNRLDVLDQLRLPYEIHYDEVKSCEEAHSYIRLMKVRGAPAIAMVAMLSLAVELKSMMDASNFFDRVEQYIKQRLKYLTTSRPTAVNLADAARKMNKAIEKSLKEAKDDQIAQGEALQRRLTQVVMQVAERMLHEDVLTNKSIGDYGAKWILSQNQGLDRTVSVVTHCNTGSLATAGYGTALGVIRALDEKKSLRKAYCTETRPYNQGSRLTAFELVHDNIPACLITDSMASALLSQKGSKEKIAAIVVGADRVSANGDTANKIGTYALAITARYHGVKFIVAAPRTTIDMGTASGEDIIIEERPSQEMTTMKGPTIRSDGEVERAKEGKVIKIAAEGIDVWNPAFDVTPYELIDAIVTEAGVAEKENDGKFHLDQIMHVSNGLPFFS